MLNVVLFTKDPCPLCDDVKRDLALIAPTFPHQLIEVDITQDQDLFLKYRFSIPVLEFQQDQSTLHELKAPISLLDLNRVFSQIHTKG